MAKHEEKVFKDEPKMTVVSDKVRVFSNRVGEIRCPDGIVLKHQSAVLVTKETADWLFASFPTFILKVD